MAELRTLAKETAGDGDSGTYRIAATPRDRFLQAAKKEMAKFERQEREFRKKERADQAAELHLPVYETRQQLQKVVELSGLFR
jgi:hypothetical protein